MKYSQEFIDLVHDSKWEGHYVGIGNPNAKVLIVGKECALNEKQDPLVCMTKLLGRIWQIGKIM